MLASTLFQGVSEEDIDQGKLIDFMYQILWYETERKKDVLCLCEY